MVGGVFSFYKKGEDFRITNLNRVLRDFQIVDDAKVTEKFCVNQNASISVQMT